MGRFLGSHASEELDRPDLNKCPDCGCFFATDACPLCGKDCPEEMRAGNRKRVKHTKERNSNAGRVTFISWYHSWWFIILMLVVSPLIGIILLATSPHKRSSKIAVVVAGLVWLFLSTFGMALLPRLIHSFEQPVDRSLSMEEYMAKCEAAEVDDFIRNASAYEGKFVSMELTVERIITDEAMFQGKKYATYFVCSENGKKLLVRDCREGNLDIVEVGDRIKVYGEGVGRVEFYDLNYETHAGVCLHMAFCEK